MQIYGFLKYFNAKYIFLILYHSYLCNLIQKPKTIMAKKEPSYRQSIEEIETILAKIENGKTDIDDLAAEIKRAAKILQDCKEKLFRTEQEVEKVVVSG